MTNRYPWPPKEQIPNAVIGVLGEAVGGIYSHTKINSLFMECAFPGDPPGGNCVEKCRAWMRTANMDENRRPLEALGELLGGFLARMPPDTDDRQSMWDRIHKALTRSGLQFDGQQAVQHLTADALGEDAFASNAAPSQATRDDSLKQGPSRSKEPFIERGPTVARTKARIFIGHGRSQTWRDLKDFVTERLHLDYEEFNREATAGLSTKERLIQMLERCEFAFLLMTADNQHADGTRHARENVIHEVGLFQGRYGFERAIVLLEDGCQEFSNIAGLCQIRYPAGNLENKFEEIRRVLEREGLLPRPGT
ncbi:MAG: nucleotide-binding protein [Phycisphaerales bacterium]|nr:nucleotide-binding protein [Phycisphaerales bacterium]